MFKVNLLREALSYYRSNVLSNKVGDYAIKHMTDELNIDDLMDTLYTYSNTDRILSAVDRGKDRMKDHCYKCPDETVTVAEYNELYEILSDIIR